jgi:3-hydroxyacyl-[acyl-carrier-protein] dehydratase
MRLEYFQLIDRIAAVDLTSRTIRMEANVPQQSTIFEGHFPGYPLMPGVLLTEAMAQTSGWLIIALTRFERMPFLASLKEVKLRNFVKPGERLEITAKILHEGSGFAMTEASIASNGVTVCDATITFRVVPFPAPELRDHMKMLAQKIDFPIEALSA